MLDKLWTAYFVSLKIQCILLITFLRIKEPLIVRPLLQKSGYLPQYRLSLLPPSEIFMVVFSYSCFLILLLAKRMKSSRYAMLLLVHMSNRGQKDTLAETIKYKFPQVNIYELFFYLVMP
jgi:hypothetical protein